MPTFLKLNVLQVLPNGDRVTVIGFVNENLATAIVNAHCVDIGGVRAGTHSFMVK